MSIALAILLRYTDRDPYAGGRAGRLGHQNDTALCDRREFATFRDL
jgi:hypothetical protein